VRRTCVVGFCILLGFLSLMDPCAGDETAIGDVTVVSGEELDRLLETRDGIVYVAIPGVRKWALAGSPDAYCPMPRACVEDAIAALEYPIDGLEIQVIILPLPRRDVPESSAEGRVVFLSPGRVNYPNEHIHYIVAHEIGHVVQHLLMPRSRADLWERYSALRSLEDLGPASVHAARPAEVFAEDFRVLFGGDLARCGGSIENHLRRPDEVEGLREFMLSLTGEWQDRVRIGAYPNPFSSEVVFEAFSLGDVNQPIKITVCDVSGRLLRVLTQQEDNSAYLTWDGRDESGRMVAPGVYFAQIRAGGRLGIRKVIRR
jgi:hypothetical protein